jgi:cold shock CspA family protein
MKGTVRRYLSEKRYGFIVPDNSDSEVFFHLSVFNGSSVVPPLTGEYVEYQLGDEGTRAESVRRLMDPLHCEGTVDSYDPLKGYGFISSSSGHCYLHKSEVLGGMVPTVGSRVVFYRTERFRRQESPRAVCSYVRDGAGVRLPAH